MLVKVKNSCLFALSSASDIGPVADDFSLFPAEKPTLVNSSSILRNVKLVTVAVIVKCIPAGGVQKLYAV